MKEIKLDQLKTLAGGGGPCGQDKGGAPAPKDPPKGHGKGGKNS